MVQQNVSRVTTEPDLFCHHCSTQCVGLLQYTLANTTRPALGLPVTMHLISSFGQSKRMQRIEAFVSSAILSSVSRVLSGFQSKLFASPKLPKVKRFRKRKLATPSKPYGAEGMPTILSIRSKPSCGI